MDQLKQARLIINETDEAMAKLFEKRMDAVNMVAKYKKEHQLSVLDEKREQEILDTCINRIKQEEYIESYRDFMKSIMDLSKQYQKKVISEDVIGYAGVEGAFSHLATLKLFPESQIKNYPTFHDVVMAIKDDEIEYGVLPFENSYTGEIGEVMDLLQQHNLFITQVFDLPIDQNLLGIKGARLEDIKQIYSHQQGLSQCAKYLNGRDVELIPYANTALAAKYISECQDIHKAAIASKATAQYYQLSLLEENINTVTHNTTRFIVISKKMNQTGNRFAMIFTVPHQSGALGKVIELIAKYDYNMENIKSRSIKERPFEYYFFVEVIGNCCDQEAIQLIEVLSQYCVEFKIVGSYYR